MNRKSVNLFLALILAVPAFLHASVKESPMEKGEEFVLVNFTFEKLHIDEECKVTIISEDETDFITRTLKKDFNEIDLELRPNMDYQMAIENKSLGSISNLFKLEGMSLDGAPMKQSILLEGLKGNNDELLGVKCVFVNSTSSEQKKIALSSKTAAMATKMNSNQVQILSRVRFFKPADQMRDIISQNDMRFDFDENTVVLYLKVNSGDIKDNDSFEQLTGEVNDIKSVISFPMDMAALTTDSSTPNNALKASIAVESHDFYFTVQLGSFQGEVKNPESVFQTSSVISNTVEGNQVKYFSGIFQQYQQARAHQTELIESGKEGVFLAAFNNGEKISVKQAIELSKKKNSME